MLQQILRDMYVDPEILAELGEEQKEMLFYKMRQEQIRRYNECNKENKIPSTKPNRNGKAVRILEDRNGDPWVWICGEGKGELTAEEKWKKARQQKENRLLQAFRREEEAKIAKLKSKFRGNNGNARKEQLVQAKEKANNTRQAKYLENLPPKGTTSPTILRKSPKLTQRTVQSPVQRRKERRVKTPPTTDNDGLRVTTPPSSGKRSPVEVHPMIAHQTPTTVPPRLPSTPPVGSPQSTPYGSPQTSVPVAKLIDIDENSTAGKSSTQQDDDDENIYEDMGSLTTGEPEVVSNEEWKSQLLKFKEEDRRRSLRARSASKEYRRQSLLASDPEKLIEIRKKSQYDRVVLQKGKPPVPTKPQHLSNKTAAQKAVTTPKPQNRQEIIDWFSSTQESAWIGDVIPTWFHGIINRQEAERLLEKREVGDFLVRVSDKIWGYALSYNDTGRVKHYLIDASKPSCFHFFGNDQIHHETLTDLLQYHQHEPITYNGEKLKNAIGQENPAQPDYHDLNTTGSETKL
uniref:SH2 domain-containing protein 4B-like n=1 Tax=Phallusia mammillata TaxID=59560 RepID=A0A6F9DSQ9_9ASCI|nr:SH2 domain-containing protein 4B-like [Phallusia mammillata]